MNRSARVRFPDQVDRANTELIDAVADVTAAILGKPKDALIVDHITQRRRTMRWARGPVITLSVLLVASVVASIIAALQRNRAVEDEARVATARQIAALAVANIGNHMDIALQLAVAAYRMDNNPQTMPALYQVVTASPHLVRYQPIDDRP